MTSQRNIAYGVNEDVVMNDVSTIVSPSDFLTSELEVTTCDNVGVARLGVAYRIANAGHKVRRKVSELVSCTVYRCDLSVLTQTPALKG